MHILTATAPPLSSVKICMPRQIYKEVFLIKTNSQRLILFLLVIFQTAVARFRIRFASAWINGRFNAIALTIDQGRAVRCNYSGAMMRFSAGALFVDNDVAKSLSVGAKMTFYEAII